jgi:hypothetical protein
MIRIRECRIDVPNKSGSRYKVYNDGTVESRTVLEPYYLEFNAVRKQLTIFSYPIEPQSESGQKT